MLSDQWIIFCGGRGGGDGDLEMNVTIEDVKVITKRYNLFYLLETFYLF